MPRTVIPEFQTLCLTCHQLHGVVKEYNRGNPRWRLSRHAEGGEGTPICGGGRVTVPDAMVMPTGAHLRV